MNRSVKNKVLLVVGSGAETLPLIQLAQQMGIFVVGSDANPRAPGRKYCDDFIVVSTYDVAGTVKASCHYHDNVRRIHGVMCMGTDVPHTVSAVSRALRLPGLSTDTAHLAVDKLHMKCQLSSDKVSIPWFTEIESLDHLCSHVLDSPKRFVLKPADSRGARGVTLINSSSNLKCCYESAVHNSPSGRVLLEQFIDGPQLSTESIVKDGVVSTIGYADRNYEYLDKFSPFIIENGGDMPSSLPQEVLSRVNILLEKAARSIGIDNGIMKGDVVVQDGNPYVIEIAARLSGGYFCSHMIPLSTGVSIVAAAIYIALGIEFQLSDFTPTLNLPVCQRYFFPSPGIVESICLDSKLLENSSIKLFEMRINNGDLLKPITSHPSRGGLVISTSHDLLSAQALAAEVISSISVKYKQ